MSPRKNAVFPLKNLLHDLLTEVPQFRDFANGVMSFEGDGVGTL
jgi:hypothetical protein